MDSSTFKLYICWPTPGLVVSSHHGKVGVILVDNDSGLTLPPLLDLLHVLMLDAFRVRGEHEAFVETRATEAAAASSLGMSDMIAFGDAASRA